MKAIGPAFPSHEICSELGTRTTRENDESVRMCQKRFSRDGRVVMKVLIGLGDQRIEIPVPLKVLRKDG